MTDNRESPKLTYERTHSLPLLSPPTCFLKIPSKLYLPKLLSVFVKVEKIYSRQLEAELGAEMEHGPGEIFEGMEE